MATIRKRGNLQWEARIRRRGYPPQSKTFNTRAQTEEWGRAIEGEMDRGTFTSRTEAENTTLAEALTRYETEVTAQKKGAVAERSRIAALKRDPLAQQYLGTIRSVDIATYKNARLKKVGTTSVRHELSLISHIFSTARKEWGMESLGNPTSLVSKPNKAPGRDRRLEGDEEQRVLAATESVELAHIVRLALETAMRRGEIAALRWEHVNILKRVLLVKNPKGPRAWSLAKSRCRHMPLKYSKRCRAVLMAGCLVCVPTRSRSPLPAPASAPA